MWPTVAVVTAVKGAGCAWNAAVCLRLLCDTHTLPGCFQTAFCSPARASARARQPPLSLPTLGVAPKLPKSHYCGRLPFSEAPSSAAPALLSKDEFL